MLQQKWVVMAGDSITRFMFAALLRLLAEDGMLLILIFACAVSKPSSLLAPLAVVPDVQIIMVAVCYIRKLLWCHTQTLLIVNDAVVMHCRGAESSVWAPRL